MKISYNWLKNYINSNKSIDEVSNILTNIGLEVEDIEDFSSLKGGLAGLVIGEVKECHKHPDADRLSITKTDLGNGNVVQIVCGAPNVAAGQKVVVATVGSTVYPISGEPFTINKAKIRGEVSEGMICAEDEIGLGQSHDGILVLPNDVKIGTPAADYFKIENDKVFEIGLTPNRVDAASHWGVARDLAAFLKERIQLENIDLPDTKSLPKPNITVEAKDDAPRYAGIRIDGIDVKESPEWLKNRLKAIGLKPINNIVDITNFILHDLGQPLHAFDWDKVEGNEIIVKKCTDGTKFTTLDGEERTLASTDLMICDTKKPICIAGVFGGKNSGITNNTKNIFLESAYFSPTSIRKASKRLGLKTDASFRYERGTDPNIPVYALKKAVILILDIAGGKISSDINDLYPNPVPNRVVKLNFANVWKLIGKHIERAEIVSIVEHLGIDITKKDEDAIELSIPPYRVDVFRECDVIEEILRIYGLDNIEIPYSYTSISNFSSKPNSEKIQETITNLLANNGFSEIITNSLCKKEYNDNADQSVTLLNPLSNELNVMRQSLLFTGLESVAYNIKHKHLDIKFFEFGKVYRKENDKYKEAKKLSLFVTGNRNSKNWNNNETKSSIYSIKGSVDSILKRLNIPFTIQEGQHKNLTDCIVYEANKQTIATLGTLKKDASQKVDISQTVYFAELAWDNILGLIGKTKPITYTEISKYPAVKRDLSILLDKNISFDTLRQIALKSEKNTLKEVSIFDIYEGDKLPQNKKSYALGFIFQDEGGTLTDEKVEASMKRIISNIEKETLASIRK